MFQLFCLQTPWCQEICSCGLSRLLPEAVLPLGLYKHPTLANTASSFEARGLKLKYLEVRQPIH